MQMQAQRQRFALVWHGVNSAANNTVRTGVELKRRILRWRDGKLDPESRANSERAHLGSRRGGHEAGPRGAGAEAVGRHGELLVERHLVPWRSPRAAALACVADVEPREQRAHHLPQLLLAASPRHAQPRSQEEQAVSVKQPARGRGAAKDPPNP